ncbi:MAG: 5-formyltetrahydrofolate cyclo-ligase [Geobacteraceae bacterium GWC2_48_7]|nr:MAG: 5-formyltetrahydrofolate cyclo-ligase [Geobacteraceae bacterium GWC2_48_7]
MPKQARRTGMLAQRRELSDSDWRTASKKAQLQLLGLEEYQRALSVALYYPAHRETDTMMIAEAALAEGKKLLFPVVCGLEMEMHQVENIDQLKPGRFGIHEPCRPEIRSQSGLPDLIVIPGVLFDLNGHRIGYGKGYYDRFLEQHSGNGHLVGLCHDFQLVDDPIPADRHDIRMEVIVTDKRVIRLGSNRRHARGPH